MKRLLFNFYIWIKGLFGASIVETTKKDSSPIPITKRIKQKFWDIYNVDAQDQIDYTNTHDDHHSHFNYLDDPEEERFGTVAEQVGLIYEEDGKTPKNAAEVFDMTYEEYEEYKEKIIPIAIDRKITEEEIKEFLNR